MDRICINLHTQAQVLKPLQTYLCPHTFEQLIQHLQTHISCKFILPVTAEILNSLKGNFEIQYQIFLKQKTITVSAHKSTIH
jgi:hypothetical protein